MTMEITPSPGETITYTAIKAISLSDKIQQVVWFMFNGVRVDVTPDDSPAEIEQQYYTKLEEQAAAYRASPEGQAAAKRNEDDLRAHQERHDALMTELNMAPFRDIWIALDWCMRWVREADRVGVKKDPARIADSIKFLGIVPNDSVGLPKEAYRDATTMCRYVLGQVLDALDSGMPVHPALTERFGRQAQELHEKETNQ